MPLASVSIKIPVEDPPEVFLTCSVLSGEVSLIPNLDPSNIKFDSPLNGVLELPVAVTT